MFRDRLEAANQLAEKLAPLKGRKPLVLAIPRGAVPMAKRIAETLEGDFDVVLVRKLQAPYQPELAIGSVDEHGWAYIAPFAAETGADEHYLAEEKQRQLDTIRKRRAQYTPIRAHINPAGRVVIVVDDGLATGATMMAALHGLREQQPERLICAVPVAPRDTLTKVRALADEVICLQVPEYFQAVGQFYQDFAQVDDAEVIELLKS